MVVSLFVALVIDRVSVTIQPNDVMRRFIPSHVLGAGVDGSTQRSIDRTFRDQNIKAMRSTGFRSLTYRLRTELGCEAWHWNSVGTWSDPQNQQGYWTGSAAAAEPILQSWGYRLPRRGDTIDQANNDGYSRLTDGDNSTYWKSNPYLDPAYSGDSHVPPQWVVIDLERHVPINAARIRWANPYAVGFRIEFWRGADNFEKSDSPIGAWHAFFNGLVTKGQGGDVTYRLGKTDSVRFVRLILLKSSHTAEPAEFPDPRDKMGFAIREIEFGTLQTGRLHDAIRHQPNKQQTPVYTSSTDPWHRSTDLDRRTDQPGFDLVFKSGLAGGLPALVPVSVLYDTPENAETEVRWLKARGYPLKGIELGEEPDGQCVDPVDYVSLYQQVAKRLRGIDSHLPLGGPSFQTTLSDFWMWPDNRPKTWVRRFTDELKRRRLTDWFNFFSFEWYPFDRPYGDSSADLKKHSTMLAKAFRRMKKGGIPTNIPWLMSEYGYSAFAGPDEVNLQSALLNLDIVGKFLSLGGSTAYFYGYEPGELNSDFKDKWGNLITWLVGPNGQAKYPMPVYWAALMMNADWCDPADGIHRLVRSESTDPSLVTFTLIRPDRKLSVMLLNEDPTKTKTVRFTIANRLVRTGEIVQFGRDQYAWKDAGKNGRPIRSYPPLHRPFKGEVSLPPYSVTVAKFASP